MTSMKKVIAEILESFENLASNPMIFNFRIFDFENLLNLNKVDINNYGKNELD